MSGGFRERFGERATRAGLDLSPAVVEALERYWALLRRWNAKINLTALPLEGHPSQALDRLLIEPLLAADLLSDSPIEWFDLGSGGGSPAIPIKLMRPRCRLTMIEVRERKAAFLREVLRSLAIQDARVETVRFEEIGSGGSPAAADVITVRAVRLGSATLAACARLLKPEGRLLVFAHERPILGPASPFTCRETVDLRATRSAVHVCTLVPRGTA